MNFWKCCCVGKLFRGKVEAATGAVLWKSYYWNFAKITGKYLRELWIWSHPLKKSLMVNFTFCAVLFIIYVFDRHSLELKRKSYTSFINRRIRVLAAKMSFLKNYDFHVLSIREHLCIPLTKIKRYTSAKMTKWRRITICMLYQSKDKLWETIFLLTLRANFK